MGDKKNIDELFQEKLKDFSGIPEDKVWQSIETSLDKKKKKLRIVPILWKLRGVAAAAIVIGLYLINPFETNQQETPNVTNVEKNDEIQNDASKNPENGLETIQVIVETNQTDTNENNIDTQIAESDITTSVTDTQENIATANTTAKTNYNLPKKGNTSPQVTSATTKDSKEALALNLTSKNDEESVASTLKKEADRVAKANNTKGSAIQGGENNFSKNSGISIDPLVSTSEKQNIALVGTDEEITGKNATKKSIFEEIPEEETEEIAENNSKWSAGPNLAPVYTNGIGNDSPIDPVFSANSKSGGINYSYGVSVAYQVNKKLSIRSGINKVDYGYDTNDVIFSSSSQAASNRKLGAINFSKEAENIVVTSNVVGSNSNLEAINNALSLDNSFSANISSTSAIQNGFLTQQIGYLEVPVELNYALIDKKFGVNLIGGVSSLFLIDNNINISRGDLTAEVGEANNINTLNFSTNVGLGVHYKITPKIQFNVEPIFKYQLNTFSTNTSFRPYSVGVYSGLNYKF